MKINISNLNLSFIFYVKACYLSLRNHLFLMGIDSLIRLGNNKLYYSSTIGSSPPYCRAYSLWWGSEYWYMIFVILIPSYFLYKSWKSYTNKSKIFLASFFIITVLFLGCIILWTQYLYVVNTGLDSL